MNSFFCRFVETGSIRICEFTVFTPSVHCPRRRGGMRSGSVIVSKRPSHAGSTFNIGRGLPSIIRSLHSLSIHTRPTQQLLIWSTIPAILLLEPVRRRSWPHSPGFRASGATFGGLIRAFCVYVQGCCGLPEKSHREVMSLSAIRGDRLVAWLVWPGHQGYSVTREQPSFEKNCGMDTGKSSCAGVRSNACRCLCCLV